MMKRLLILAVTISISALFVSCSTVSDPIRVEIPRVASYDIIHIIEGLSIEAGISSSFIIQPDGSLWAWGSNTTGQLGMGTSSHFSFTYPVPAKIMDDVAYVSAWGSGRQSGNQGHVLAIRTDGSLWSWGRNDSGQLGDGSNILRGYPAHILCNTIAMSAGGWHSLAIKSDNSLWAWGSNEHGQLGDGTFDNRYSPVRIMDDVISVSAGHWHTMAIKSDGSLWAWGVGGRLGNGTPYGSNTPQFIMDGVVDVSAGRGHNLALLSDSSLWAWGINEFGEVGDGTMEARYSPLYIMSGVVSISASASHSAAIKDDRSLWTWGENIAGQLGDGTTEIRSYPINIMDEVVAVSAGGATHGFTLALHSDGGLWAWGDNVSGQLGVSRAITQHYPVQILQDMINS